MKRGYDIGYVLSPLSISRTQAYLTDALQVADVLEWILQQTGTAEVLQTSFSISEEFLRRLFFIKSKGCIRSLTLLLDMKAAQKTVRLCSFIRNVADKVYLAENHSKILLVKAASGKNVAVVTSQNLTRGNRFESAVVSSEPELFDRLHSQLMDILTNKSLSLDAILK